MDTAKKADVPQPTKDVTTPNGDGDKPKRPTYRSAGRFYVKVKKAVD